MTVETSGILLGVRRSGLYKSAGAVLVVVFLGAIGSGIWDFALWVANYYSARNPLRLSSLVILGVVARMFRCATRSSCWCT